MGGASLISRMEIDTVQSEEREGIPKSETEYSIEIILSLSASNGRRRIN